VSTAHLAGALQGGERAGPRLRSFDADFVEPPAESHDYFVVFEKPK
jgi:hypothetical protein